MDERLKYMEWVFRVRLSVDVGARVREEGGGMDEGRGMSEIGCVSNDDYVDEPENQDEDEE